MSGIQPESPSHRRVPSMAINQGKQILQHQQILEMSFLEVEDIDYKQVRVQNAHQSQKNSFFASTAEPISSGVLSDDQDIINPTQSTYHSISTGQENGGNQGKELFVPEGNFQFEKSVSPKFMSENIQGVIVLCMNCGITDVTKVVLTRKQNKTFFQKFCICEQDELLNAPTYSHYCSNCGHLLGKVQTFM